MLFILKTAFFILGTILFFAFAAFVFSFVMFKIRATGLWYAPGFGARGMGLFFARFPWHWLIFALAVVVILEILARKFSFVYRRPLVYSVLGILLFVSIIGLVVSHTVIHPQLFRGAAEGRIPIIGSFYRERALQALPNVHIGEVSAVGEQGLTISNEKGEIFEVLVSPQTILPKNQEIEEGDLIMIMGDKKDSSVNAFGVRIIEEDRDLFFPMFDNRKPPRNDLGNPGN